MKVPKYIKDAIVRNAKANRIANETDRLIREWFIKNKVNNDSVIDFYLDSCDTENQPEEFIEFLEQGSYRKGNESIYGEDEEF
ncbi:hypothetical protein A616_16995 [Brevibacillus brevis X23]|nr:hypothetical protein A616_16995 [Brevibacillus brevis X23]